MTEDERQLIESLRAELAAAKRPPEPVPGSGRNLEHERAAVRGSLLRVAGMAMGGLEIRQDATSVPPVERARLEIAWEALEPIDPTEIPEGEPRERFVETKRMLTWAIGAAELGVGPSRGDGAS